LASLQLRYTALCLHLNSNINWTHISCKYTEVKFY